jgi:hypothetical protein
MIANIFRRAFETLETYAIILMPSFLPEELSMVFAFAEGY